MRTDMEGPMEDGFPHFAEAGSLTWIVDGALGIASGVVSSSVLLSFGVPPAAPRRPVNLGGECHCQPGAMSLDPEA